MRRFGRVEVHYDALKDIFFFSSRRRHTRSLCDWSSDVCSSDLGRMLEAGGHKVLVGGNIGHALSAQVEASTADTIHVVEASSFQLESIDTFRPWIAVLLNFSPDHLDRHADVAEYAAAK